VFIKESNLREKKTLKYSAYALNGVIPDEIMKMEDQQIEEKISTMGHKVLDQGERRPEVDEDFDQRYSQKINRFVSSQGDTPKIIRRSNSIDRLLAQNAIEETPEIHEELSPIIKTRRDRKRRPKGNPKDKGKETATSKVTTNRFVQSSLY